MVPSRGPGEEASGCVSCGRLRVGESERDAGDAPADEDRSLPFLERYERYSHKSVRVKRSQSRRVFYDAMMPRR